MVGKSVSAEAIRRGVNLSDYSLQFCRWFLLPIGAWPASAAASKRERFYSLLLVVLSFSLVGFTVFCSLLNMMLSDDSIRLKLKTFGPFVHWTVGGCNLMLLLSRGKDIQLCIDHMRTDWRTVNRVKDQEIMLRNAKIGRFISVTCAVWLQGGVLGFCAVTALSTVAVQVGNETRLVHPMPCSVYKKMLNVDESPTNEIVLVSQFLSGAVVNTVSVGVYSMAAVFAAHACGQLDVIMTWIAEFVNKTEKIRKVVRYSEIGIIVKHHLRTLSFISHIEEIMQWICFMILAACTTDICMLCYYILTEWTEHNIQNLSTYIVILLAYTFNVFVMCYIGDILSEQCLKVGEVVYMTNWYYLPDKTVLDLILIIKRSSVTIKITAGKIIEMSISTFGSVMKTAFAYVNFLRQTT
ncbi:uncharacterized protein LOC116427998 [Nomia melanderi]|uniref:uncharacterized protein LOC116427998 n=1 Tax=Nomia melanderi TaxID=2448451 RepID=UPI0013043A98|nr:uncharacterized protein LOC116427998 [Nomia melanderi]